MSEISLVSVRIALFNFIESISIASIRYLQSLVFISLDNNALKRLTPWSSLVHHIGSPENLDIGNTHYDLKKRSLRELSKLFQTWNRKS